MTFFGVTLHTISQHAATQKEKNKSMKSLTVDLKVETTNIHFFFFFKVFGIMGNKQQEGTYMNNLEEGRWSLH